MEVFPQLADGTLGSAVATPTANSNKVRIGRLNGDASLDVAGVGWERTPSASSSTTEAAAFAPRSPTRRNTVGTTTSRPPTDATISS